MQKIVYAIVFLFIISPLVLGENQATDWGYEPYEKVLHTYVNDHGMVDYQGLKKNPEDLNIFLQSLKTLDPERFHTWEEAERLAFWMNAYNALTLKVIIDHYPIKASLWGSLRFPKNSIRQIAGVWTKITFNVMGKEQTLDDIEHKIIRKQFNEPRIHFALVCAAKGCPILRNAPYVPERLSEQLDDQVKRLIQNPEKFRIEQQENTVYVTSLMKWYGEDFVPTYGEKTIDGLSQTESAIMRFFAHYVSEQERQFLLRGNYNIAYLDYDWSLNEQVKE